MASRIATLVVRLLASDDAVVAEGHAARVEPNPRADR
jgi:hypothetical protein